MGAAVDDNEDRKVHESELEHKAAICAIFELVDGWQMGEGDFVAVKLSIL